jgi:hypothetical protein
MKTGTLLLLGGIALLAVKSGALGRLASAAPDVTPSGGGDPVDTPIDRVIPETKVTPVLVNIYDVIGYPTYGERDRSVTLENWIAPKKGN